MALCKKGKSCDQNCEKLKQKNGYKKEPSVICVWNYHGL